MNELGTVPHTTRSDVLIDWVRDECSEQIQRGIALRQALRCLPSIFGSDRADIRLRNCQAIMAAFVDLCHNEKPERSKWLTIGQMGIEPLSASNASISIREAARAIFKKSLHATPTSREVELSLADSFDMLRDLFEESTGIQVEDSFPHELQKFRYQLIKAVSEDCQDVIEHGNGFVFTELLWPVLTMKTSPFDYALASFDAAVTESPQNWSFWRDWYQGFLDGKPFDWELQRRIALIPDGDWDLGPEHIAKLIEEIRARFELEKRIEELEAEKRVWTDQQRREIGGNNPPEPIETPEAKVIREIIWAPIEELKAETKKDKPDKGRIRAAIEKLWKGIKWIGLKATEAAIAAAVGASFANPAKAQELLQDIVDAAQKWLATLM